MLWVTKTYVYEVKGEGCYNLRQVGLAVGTILFLNPHMAAETNRSRLERFIFRVWGCQAYFVCGKIGKNMYFKQTVWTQISRRVLRRSIRARLSMSKKRTGGAVPLGICELRVKQVS